MALRFSTALRNHLNRYGSIAQAFQGGELRIFTGAQPATADAAQSGTLLVTITNNAEARTAEVRGSASITLSGSGGQVDSVTWAGIELLPAAVPYNSSLTQTAADVAAAINQNATLGLRATSSGAVLTVFAPRGMGAAFNGDDLDMVVSGGTLAENGPVAIGSGVASVNGLLFSDSVAGVLSKRAGQTWSGAAVASGVAGWFRLIGAGADSGATDGSGAQIRLDGNVGVTGANLNITNTTITETAIQTVTTFNLTYPAQGA